MAPTIGPGSTPPGTVPPGPAPGNPTPEDGEAGPALGVRRLGGDVALRVAARIGGAGLQAATLLLLARELGPGAFGSVAVFSSIGMLLGAVASLGASTRVLRLRAEAEPETLLPSLYWMQLGGSLLVLLGLVVAAVLTGDAAPAVVGALIAFSDAQMEFRVSHLSGQVRQSLASINILGQRGLTLLAVGGAALLAVPVLPVVGVVVVVVALLALVPGPAHRVAPRTVLRSARTSLGYWLSGLVANLNQLEPAAVGATGGVGAAGLFAIAARVSNPLSIVVTSLQAIAVPEMARAADPKEFRRLFRLLLGVAVVYAAALVLGSPLVAAVFLAVVGPQYEGARTLVTVLVVCAGLSAVSQALQARLLAVGRPATPAWIVGGGTVVGLVLLLVTSPIDGGAYLWVAPLAAQLLIFLALAVVPVRGGVAATPDRS